MLISKKGGTKIRMLFFCFLLFVCCFRKSQLEDDLDNSFMRNAPFPYTVVGFGICLIVMYYLLITRLPPSQKGWIPMANIGVVTVAFIFVMRSLTGD